MVDYCARRVGVLVLATAGVVGGVWGGGSAGAQVLGRSETVASTGQALPAGGGVGSLSAFDAVVINEAGTVAYMAVLTGTAGGLADDTGVFIRTAGGVTRFVAREGQTVPGGNGTLFSLGGVIPQLDDSDGVGISTALVGTSGGSLDNSALLRYQFSTNSLVTAVREGSSALNGQFASFGRFALSADGAILHHSTTRNTAGGTVDDTGIFGSSAGFLFVVAREGSTTPIGGTYGVISGQIGVGGASAVAFTSTVLGVPGVTAALFRSNGGNVIELVREGDSIPGGGGAFANLTFADPVLNEAGQVLFSTSLTGTANGSADNTGLFRTDGTTTVTILREGQLAPKGGGTINAIITERLNNRGQAAVGVTLAATPGGPADNTAYYLGSGSTLVELARSGNEVPGGDGVFSLSLSSMFLADAGFVAFAASIAGASSTSVNEGIYLADGTDTIQVARKGSSLGGSTISELSLTPSDGTAKQKVNESGQVVYRARLANGNEQLVVFTPKLRYRSASSGSWDTVSRWTLGITPNGLHDVSIDPTTSVTVSGPASAVTVRSLTIGGGTGIGTLDVGAGTVTATNGVTVLGTGVLTGDGLVVGAVVNNGTVRADNLTLLGTLTNNGLITGNGRISAAIISAANAEIRAEAGQTLRLGGGTLTNQGLVRVIGTPTAPAQLEVSGAATNAASTGLITASDAFVTFAGGLTNAGSVAVSTGGADVFGDINNQATGRITITGGAAATFYDDVTQNGILRVATVGNTRSVAVFLGGFTGAGGATGGGDIFFEGDLRPGNSPAFVNFDANVSFGPGVTTFMELGGLGDGQYDRITVSGVLALDGVLDVRFLAGLEPSGGTPVTYKLLQAGALVGDFDSILLPTLVGRDWFVQRTDTSLTIGSFTVIPEPGMVGVVGCAVGVVGMRRRR